MDVGTLLLAAKAVCLAGVLTAPALQRPYARLLEPFAWGRRLPLLVLVVAAALWDVTLGVLALAWVVAALLAAHDPDRRA